VEKRMAVGKALPDETAQLVSLKRTVLLYDMMMGDLINKSGCRPVEEDSLPERERIDRLAAELAPYVKNPLDEIKDTLSHAFKAGSIICKNRDGETRLRWVDYLD
jgi:hypothetical protein